MSADVVAASDPDARRPRRAPGPGEREHGELSHHRAGPNPERHEEDVRALLTEQRDEAEKLRQQATNNRDRAAQQATQWKEAVEHYDRLLAGLRVKPGARRA